jgi:hypothetical protein
VDLQTDILSAQYVFLGRLSILLLLIYVKVIGDTMDESCITSGHAPVSENFLISDILF